MMYNDVLTIALAILTSIITGGFVLVFVEIGNRKNRENDKHDQIMTPFMHKLSAYFRFISWCSSHIVYPKPLNYYEKEFKSLVSMIGGYGGRAITSGGDYGIEYFTVDELCKITSDINNIWYFHDKMHPCRLSWAERLRDSENYITKELKEINPIYLKDTIDVDLVAKVSGEFYTDVYQPIEGETYRHEAYQLQYGRQTVFVVLSFLYVLLMLSLMLFLKFPMLLLQIAAFFAILLLVASLMLLAIDVRKQIGWWNHACDYYEKYKSNGIVIKSVVNKMKNYLGRVFDLFLDKIVLIGLFFAAWSIFCIEIPFIPKIPTCLSVSVTEGLNNLLLALSYSYVAGVIIYWFTVKFPYWRNKLRLAPVIESKIATIGNLLLNMTLEFRDNENPRITEIDDVMAVFKKDRWKSKCRMPGHASCRNVTEAFIQDNNELKRKVDSLINDYKNYLSANQLIMLEILRDNSINQFFSISERSGNMYEYSDYFYEKVLLPAYRNMLEVYNKLTSI